MAEEPTRSERPRDDLPAVARAQVQIWSALAEVASDVAHAKRAIFLAYVAEGFTEAQAIDLVKSV
jgi:hypothetical protein